MSNFNREKVQKWISEYWTEPKNCQVCGNNNWLLIDNVWALPLFEGGGIKLGGPVLPVIALMCNVCGHTLFFNAIAAKVIEPSGSKEGENE